MTALDHANISYQVGEQLGLPLVFCGPDGAVRSMTAAAVDMLGTAAAAGAGGFLALLTAAGVDDSERVLALSCREPAEIWLQRGGRRLSVELRGHRGDFRFRELSNHVAEHVMMVFEVQVQIGHALPNSRPACVVFPAMRPGSETTRANSRRDQEITGIGRAGKPGRPVQWPT